MDSIRRYKIRPGLQDFAVVGFVLTAGVGYWAAYDRDLAVSKLLAIAIAAAIYLTLARTSGPNLWGAAMGCGKLCAALAVLIFLAAALDGSAGPPLATRIGLDVRGLRVPDLDTEIGLVVILLPFQIAAAVYSWQRGEQEGRIGWLVACLLLAAWSEAMSTLLDRAR